MARTKNKKFIIYISAVILLFVLAFLFFNDSGLFKYMELKNQVNTLSEQIKDVEEENQRLQNEIDSLKQNIPAKIEQVAREKYQMVRPGEKTYKAKE